MREILFRGKRVDTGAWVYGYYCPVVRGKFPATPCIVSDCDGVWEGIPIIPETVGQYTGLISNDEKLFTDDIIRMSSGLVGVIKDAADICGYEIKWLDKEAPSSSLIHQYLKDDYEIIGNIHDNPELLEVAE